MKEINIKAEINDIEKISRINKTKADSSNKLEHKQGRQGILNKGVGLGMNRS